MRFNLPPSASILRLARFNSRDELILCEAMQFEGGVSAIDTILRRAEGSGRVEIGGEIKNHFADVLDKDGSMVETIALDKKSYAILKNKWMRCKVEKN